MSVGDSVIDATRETGWVNRDDADYREALALAESALVHLNHVRQWAAGRADARMRAVSEKPEEAT
jgi:hypothetical protein